MELNFPLWRKARLSGENGGNCIEVASALEIVAVRDSKDPAGPMLLVERGAFRRFAEQIKGA
ncbi:DUF397 domain-containing protein [Spirillospora sp. NPDC127200]